MGYHSAKRRRSERELRLGIVEVVCIVLVVAAVIGLIVWIISTAGGGALMT